MELAVGAIVEGKVTGITKFGAFVALEGGKTGMVHISEVAHTYVSDINEYLTVGQDVKVKVIAIDPAGKINLSIKKATPPPPRQQNGNRDRQPRTGNAGNRTAERPAGRPSREPRMAMAAEQAPGPADFEARLKQFMQASDSKLSDLKLEKKSSRRGRK